MDRGTFTSTSENTRKIFRRRLIRIKDETGTISITIWNAKVDDSLFIKTKNCISICSYVV